MIIDLIKERRKTMNNKDGSNEWLRLPVRAMQDSDLTACDVLVLSYILDRVDSEEKAVSITSITEKTGLSERQVRYSIENLIANKYITANKHKGQVTTYSQCDVLPPKRQPKKPKITTSDDNFDIEEYKEFVNDI